MIRPVRRLSAWRWLNPSATVAVVLEGEEIASELASERQDDLDAESLVLHERLDRFEELPDSARTEQEHCGVWRRGEGQAWGEGLPPPFLRQCGTPRSRIGTDR